MKQLLPSCELTLCHFRVTRVDHVSIDVIGQVVGEYGKSRLARELSYRGERVVTSVEVSRDQ